MCTLQHMHAQWREPAEEIPWAQEHKNKRLLEKKFPVSLVGYRSVLKEACLCLDLKTVKNALSNGRFLTSLPLQSCDFAQNAWTRGQHALTSSSTCTLEPGSSLRQACTRIFSPKVVITIFLVLFLQTELYNHTIFAVAGNNKMELWTFLKKICQKFFLGICK